MLVNIEWTRHVLENMNTHLLVELDVGEYGVDAPGSGEHEPSPLLSWTLVNMEWTGQVLENMGPHLLVEMDVGEY